MATPNYSFEKRQRELAKKRKAEEKRMRKNDPHAAGPVDEAGEPIGPGAEEGHPQAVNPTPGQAG